MNAVLNLLNDRKSVRAYSDQEITPDVRQQILQAAFRSPTAGNMMLYSIIDVTDQTIKERLVTTCDHQAFIAKAPLVLLFLADYQRWHDYFLHSRVDLQCHSKGEEMRCPEEGDLFLACCDALIAAQTSVIAAESLGVGSCYIGDIMENYEIHQELFNLPQYTFPIALVCYGYPTEKQLARKKTPRFDEQYILFENQYRSLSGEDFESLVEDRQKETQAAIDRTPDVNNFGQLMYARKFNAEFSHEMSRSVRAILERWQTK
jgi:nitroreductase